MQEFELYDVPTFLQKYCISRTTFYDHIKKGNLRVKKDGKRTRITREAAEEWIKNLEEKE